MKEIGLGTELGDLKIQLKQLTQELKQLEQEKMNIPELIESTQLLRSNEFLTKTNQKKSDLINIYTDYSTKLENLLSSVFEIQVELKDLIKNQSGLLSNQKIPRKNIPKIKKPTKKKKSTKSKKPKRPRSKKSEKS